MGLDMFLYTYPKGLEENIKKIESLSNEERNKVWDEVFEVAYWRKCNFLHKYLCDNGEEITSEIIYLIPRKVLYDFLEKTVKVVKRKNTRFSSKTLPTCSGFFYGSTEYDENYYDQGYDAILKITEILKNSDDEKFLYYASW